jgi:hypothetical protein
VLHVSCCPFQLQPRMHCIQLCRSAPASTQQLECRNHIQAHACMLRTFSTSCSHCASLVMSVTLTRTFALRLTGDTLLFLKQPGAPETLCNRVCTWRAMGNLVKRARQATMEQVFERKYG